MWDDYGKRIEHELAVAELTVKKLEAELEDANKRIRELEEKLATSRVTTTNIVSVHEVQSSRHQIIGEIIGLLQLLDD